MLKYEEALRKILDNTNRLQGEIVAIEDAIGCVLLEDIYSNVAMPPFNKSAMDGYALRNSDLKSVPVQLKCIGVIEAGDSFKKTIKRGECAKIMTGAPLPRGADSVVMVEDTYQEASKVQVRRHVRKSENVCFKGEDIKRRQKVLSKGTVISTSNVALLAAVGKSSVRVYKKPRVAVLNTGGEIIPAGCKLSGNRIYNSNGPQLVTLLRTDGIQPRFLGIAQDKPKILQKAISKGLGFDIVLISGGVSMGDYDLVPSILMNLGVKKIFHKVKIKPGKPLFFGKRCSTLVFGIPGNPVSNFLTYHIYIRPALLKMAGKQPNTFFFRDGILTKSYSHKPGRKHFVLAVIRKVDFCYYITPLQSHGSADIMALSKANGFMIVEAHISHVEKNSKIKFVTWE